jgi:hypothetical protein
MRAVALFVVAFLAVSAVAQTDDIDYGDEKKEAAPGSEVEPKDIPEAPVGSDKKVDAEEVPDTIHGIDLNHHSKKVGNPKMRGDKPWIKLNGNATEVYILGGEETPEHYTDGGAKCFNKAGESMSERLEIGGQWVNLAAAGTYFTKYGCTDTKGLKVRVAVALFLSLLMRSWLQADHIFRKIIVHDENAHTEM